MSADPDRSTPEADDLGALRSPRLGRRSLLKTGTSVVAAVGLGRLTSGAASAASEPSHSVSPTTAAADKGDDEILVGGYFTAEISGAPLASAHIRSVTVDDIKFDARQTGRDRDGWRVYAPGESQYGRATLTYAPTAGNLKELFRWWSEAAAGKNVRKSISIVILSRDQDTGRTYNLIDCFPVSFSAVDFTTGGEANVAKLVVQPTLVEPA